jgi:DNA-directed RNA polymerase subunit RPC12/RpoP
MMSDDKTGQPTCPTCGATRSPAAVPYQEATDAFAVYTCASCGAQFESWITHSAPRDESTGQDPVQD